MIRVVCVAPFTGLVLLLCLAGRVPADEPTPTIETLVRELGDPSFAVRERAAARLWEAGPSAIPALEAAADSPNPEVARRAREILARFDWGIFPDTPPAVLTQIRRFRNGLPEERIAAVAELLKLGKPGIGAVRCFLRLQLTPADRAAFVTQLTTRLRRDVPLLLFEGKTAEAAELMSLHAAGTDPRGASDYAAFHIINDTLPVAIRTAEVELKTGRNTAAVRLVLAHLYRATGDWEKARAAAAEIPRRPNEADPITLLREEEGDWAGLSGNLPAAPLNLPTAFDLTMLRLAGRQKEFNETVARLRSDAESAGAITAQDTAAALLLNNRAADAAEVLATAQTGYGLLTEIRIAGLRYQEVLALTEIKGVSERDQIAADIRRARALMHVGRREEAVKLFTQQARALTRGFNDPDLARETPALRRALLRNEVRLGLRDLAAEHAASFLPHADPGEGRESGESAFDILFGNDAATAETLYWALRAKPLPGDDAGAVLKRVRSLIAGWATADVVDEVVRILREDVDASPSPLAGTSFDTAGRRRKVARLLALAAVLQAANRDNLTIEALTQAAELTADTPEVAGPRSWVFGTSDAGRPYAELGEFLIERGRYREAATRLEAGWKRFPDQPLLLFLSGQALVKAGDITEGRRRIALSHCAGLGDERVRGKFLEDLVRRGEARAARRETDLLLRACWPRDHHFGNVMNQAGRAAAMFKDFATAERCAQRSLLVLMKVEGMYFVDPASYLAAPHEMFVHRIRATLAAGKVDEAVRMARVCLDVTPGHIGLVSALVPELERIGRKREADELFTRAWSAYQKVLAEYPDGPMARHGLAALGANCRRELDTALKRAREAVALDPTSPEYREVLAEVYFRRGDRTEALAIMTKLSTEFPRNRVYQRQLTRYRTGDLASPIPLTVDD